MPRILHISTRLILGGSQENTVLSCEGQARLGHEVHLAFGPIYGPEGSMLERVAAFRTPDGRSITTHVIPDLVREVSPRRDRRCLRQLEALIRALRPDIVHTHSSKAGILGRLAAWNVRREREGGRGQAEHTPGIVHTIHGPPFMPVEGSPLRRTAIRLKNTAYTFAERRAARRCDVIVSVADAMTAQFLARGIGRPEQYVTVRSGMETARFLSPAGPGGSGGETREAVRAELGFGPDDYVIGTVARLAEHKGHDDVLDALGDELARRPRWKLLWVGDGWWRERLFARVEAMGLGSGKERASEGGRVVCTGLVPPERVAAHMRAMDLLVHPSYREGLPRTVPQALLCGTPVVAYDADGTREACIHGETGLLVRVGDRAGLRDAVVRMAEDPAFARSTAERGRAMCAAAFSAEAMVEGLERVYARAMGARWPADEGRPR